MNTKPPSTAPVSDEKDWGSRQHLQTLVLMFATGLVIYLCYRMALPFLAALAWALAFAVLFTPLQAWLEIKLKRASLAALTSVFLIALIVVVPAAFVGQQLLQQAAQGAVLVESKVSAGEWRKIVVAQPRLAPLVERVEQQLDLPGTAKEVATWISTFVAGIVRGSVFQLLGVCLTFYLLFFFLRDRALILQSLRKLSPLTRREMDRLYTRIDDTIHATVYGTLAVSAVQGLLGGLMFWWLGLSAPLLWGLVMAVLAVVPVLGAFVVWVPAALFLLLEGSWGKALILALWGMLVVGTIDNMLRPILVGNRLKLHTVLAFLSVVGGLILFGPAGLILGPVTLTLTTVLLEIWSSDPASNKPRVRRKSTHNKLESNRCSRASRSNLHFVSRWKILVAAVERFEHIDGTQWAAAFAHFAFFALFPLIVLFVTIASIFIDRGEAGASIIAYVEMFVPIDGESRSFIFGTVAGVIAERGQASMVAFLMLAWAGMGVFSTLIRATNRAWGVNGHNWWRLPLRSLAFLLIMVVLVLSSIATPLIAKATQAWLSPTQEFRAWVYSGGNLLLPMFIVFLGLTLFYRIAPRRRTRLSEVWIAALCATLLLQVSDHLFVIYLKYFVSFNAVYGTFGGIIAMLLWIYLAGCIFVFGACLCAAQATAKADVDATAVAASNSNGSTT